MGMTRTVSKEKDKDEKKDPANFSYFDTLCGMLYHLPNPFDPVVDSHLD